MMNTITSACAFLILICFQESVIATSYSRHLLNRSNVDAKSMVEIEGRRYYISPPTTQVTALEATTFCNDIGMRLVNMETEEKLDAICNYLFTTGVVKTCHWSGGRQILKSWMWSGLGQLFTYFKWDVAEIEPDMTGDNLCMCFTQGGMHDADCGWNFPFMCEQSECVDN